MLWLIVAAPLAAALLAGILALTRRVERIAPLITLAAVLVSGGVALSARQGTVSATWLTIPPHFDITLGVHLDPMAFVMVCVVTLVSALVQLYSIGYMKGENGYARYFAYLSLFTASMLGLVLARNLFQLYVCWELVGICSYLLIGFWWFKPSAANAAKKAFVVTRFGDVGFMLGVLLLSSAAGSFDFGRVEQAFSALASGSQPVAPLVAPHTFLWLAPLLLFCGAIGKSAQFPLHVWLPDAMEGPTPVSALIHAATMVAAGVYMVARLLPLFAATLVATEIVLVIGMITAFMAATIALVQTDIKKVMAYSTISQLGYMMMGLGAGGANGRYVSMFHLTTHAMFKALLFLTAGSVIHALHHSEEPNNLQRMGGLLKRMPVTAWTCLVGVLALDGIFPLAGFWSKDAILGELGEAGQKLPLSEVGLIVGIAVAGLTAFYGMRMWLMAFWGEPRSEAAEHAHESPVTMTAPLVILAIPSVVLGWWLHASGSFASAMAPAGGETHAGGPEVLLASITTAVALASIALAWRLYARPRLETDAVQHMPAPLCRTFGNLWYMDAFWNTVGARGTLALGRTIAWIDRNVVDRYVANGPAWLCSRAGGELRRSATGQTQTYAAALLATTVLVLALLLWQAAGGVQSRESRVESKGVVSARLMSEMPEGRRRKAVGREQGLAVAQPSHDSRLTTRARPVLTRN